MFDRRKFLASLIACPACAALPRMAQAAGPHFEYEGAAGPEKWGDLDQSFKACSVGAEQSPIDLKGSVQAAFNRPQLDWKPQAFQVVNNGHTIQANAQAGSSMLLDGVKFNMAQFHFHTPSEHAIDGKRTAMEVHFVHAGPNGRLAVVGVLMKAGRRNNAFRDVMAVAPKKEGEVNLPKPVDPRAFLPAKRGMMRYEGSLTTPPCSEVVDWNVFTDPVDVAQSDIDAFKAIFPMNARPLQPVNRRYLLRRVS